MQNSITCYFCHHQWMVVLPLSRRDECPSCGKDCKVCLNCRFYAPGSYHECRESEAEWVKEKDLGTYCSYFIPREQGGVQQQEDNAKANLNALFKEEKVDENKITNLDQLFKK